MKKPQIQIQLTPQHIYMDTRRKKYYIYKYKKGNKIVFFSLIDNRNKIFTISYVNSYFKYIGSQDEFPELII